MDIASYLDRKREEVDRFLDTAVPSAQTAPATLHESMRYSLFAGGKRIRPILAMASAEAVGQPSKAILPIASSLELIHTYSLIHDDLPAMDNDDYRRGKPTNHKGYGEAMAILAGDALLTLAFDLCSRADLLDHLDPIRQVPIIHELALGAGELGKTANADAQRGKKPYPPFCGVEGARTLADQCANRAISRLDTFDAKADSLRELARYITSRRN